MVKYVSPVTNLLEKGARTFNVKAFGAVGNGTANDTSAIQSAFDAANAAGGGVVFFPPGIYYCDPVYAYDKVSAEGAGSGVSTIKRRPATTTNPDSVGNINWHGSSDSYFTGFFIRSLAIDGNKANVTVNIGAGGDPYDVEGFSFKFCQQFTVDSCRASNAYSEGFDLDDCKDGTIINSVMVDNGGSGVHCSIGTTNMRIVNNYATGNGTMNDRSGFDQYSAASNCVFIGNISENNNRNYGIAGSGAIFVGNKSQGTTTSNDIYTGVTGSKGTYRYQSGDGTNSMRGAREEQEGWGYVQGDGSNTYASKTVTFPEPFDEVPIVTYSGLGVKTTAGAPNTPSSATNSINSFRSNIWNAVDVTTTGFTIICNGSSTLATSSYPIFHWRAAGTLKADTTET